MWAAVEGVEGRWRTELDVSVELVGSHAEKLNRLATMAIAEADEGDHLLFLDGDAFPVAPLEPDAVLGGRPLAAVQRLENLGDPQPHPCFCLTTPAFWTEVHGDWRPGYTWVNELGRTVTDVGGNLLGALLAAGAEWRPLLRSNTRDLHPVFFAVYGNLVYHHGAGFRRWKVERVDRAGSDRPLPWEAGNRARTPRWLPILGSLERRARRRLAVGRVRRLSEPIERIDAQMTEAIRRDDDLLRLLVGPSGR